MQLSFTCFTPTEFKFELMIIWAFKIDKVYYTFIFHFYRLKLFLFTLISFFRQMQTLIGVISIFLRSTGKRLVKLRVHLLEGEDYALSRFTRLILINHILKLI